MFTSEGGANTIAVLEIVAVAAAETGTPATEAPTGRRGAAGLAFGA